MTDETAAADGAAQPSKTTGATPAPAPSAPGKAALADAVSDAVDGWVGTLRDSPLSRFTPAWNSVQEKIPALKAAIVAALAQ